MDNVSNQYTFTDSTPLSSFLLPALWASEVCGVLDDSNVSAEKILEVLSKQPILKDCYAQDAGVSEGYSVGQHAKMVLDVALQFRGCLLESLQEVVSWGEFLLFLALHDIGKGIANKNQGAYSTSLSFKEMELRTTQKIIAEVMQTLDVPASRVALFCEMVSYDTQGLYLKGEIGQAEVFDNIVEMAHNCKIDVSTFYRLFVAFHMVDAASYPRLRSIFEIHDGVIKHNPINEKKVEALAKSLEETVEGKISFDECLKKIKNKEDPGIVEAYFLDQLPKILKFLEKVHKEMLLLTGKTTPEQKALFCEVKRGFRDIFLYFAATSSNLERIETIYKNGLCNSLGMRDYSRSSTGIFRYFFNSANVSYDKTMVILQLEDAIMNFRKDYLCRFSINKVAKFIEDSSSIDSQASIPFEAKGYNLLSFLSITYIHGTNAAILPNLLKTGMQLISSGRLISSGVVPFSGELKEGSSPTGINRYLISGTSLDDGARAYKYATSNIYQTIPSAEKERITFFLTMMQEYIEKKNKLYNANYDAFRYGGEPGDSSSSRLSAAILRVRGMYPDFYKEHAVKLNEIINRLDEDWTAFESSDQYKNNMPKKEDPNGDLGYKYHDYYWYRQFNKVKTNITTLKNSLNMEVKVPAGIMKVLENPYGLVMASKTLHTIAPDSSSPSERCAQKASKLGKDIQIIFVNANNEHSLSEFLKGQGLHEKVSIVTMDILPMAIQLNKLASPYFADVVSSKKIAQLKVKKSPF